MLEILQVPAPTNIIGLVAILGAIVLNGIVSLLTLVVANKTHKVANSRLTETINKVDVLTAALEQSREQNRQGDVGPPSGTINTDEQTVPNELRKEAADLSR